MGWFRQAATFFKEVRNAKKQKEEQLPKQELEFVSSASEARLLHAPAGASFLILVTFLLIISLIIWAVVSPIDEVAKASGKVIPSKQIQSIQNLEGGILKELKVREGQIVEKGEVIAILDDTAVASSFEEQKNSYVKLLARIQRLDAEYNEQKEIEFTQELDKFEKVKEHEIQLFESRQLSLESKIDEADFEVTKAKAELDTARTDFAILSKNFHIAKQEMDVNEAAFERHAISKIEYIKEKQRLNELQASLKKSELLIPQARANFHSMEKKKESVTRQNRSELLKERSEIEVKLEQIQARSTALKDKVLRTTLIAPETGTIKEIYINTIGGVIRPGMVIMDIVPLDDQLLIEVKVKPKDIGFIHKGLKGKVKFTAFDFSKYGGLVGTVDYVSADTITDKKGISFYQVRIRTDKTTISDKKGGQLQIIPGMQAEVNIIIDTKSILEYIVKPVLKL